ncbi:MAG: toll/interleukin-1 receptor domain-containing protein, partial [Thermoanaerobaculia bacterium]
MKRDIFISHRHDDKPIADVLKKHLLGWAISEDRIFLSSSVDNAPQIGGALQDELQKALYEARVLFFLFTSSGADWSWCIYEIGLATDPETHTRIVVLKCTDD